MFLAALITGCSAPASPSPGPLRRDYMPSGATYPVIKKPQYLDYKPTPGETITSRVGYIQRYIVLNEKMSERPSATALFIPNDSGKGTAIIVSYPLKINGKVYECTGNKTTELARRFHVCQSLPSEVMGAQHPVTVHLYDIHDSGITGIQATDSIESR